MRRCPNAYTYTPDRTDLQVAKTTARAELMRAAWGAASASDLKASLELLLEFELDEHGEKLVARLRQVLMLKRVE